MKVQLTPTQEENSRLKMEVESLIGEVERLGDSVTKAVKWLENYAP